jgi:dTDP-glucose 4,6-dehydratase
MILITGGSGFIGANFIINWFNEKDEPIVNLDKLTYAANQNNLLTLNKSDKYFFEKGSIEDSSLVTSLLEKYKPRAIINFAAESHVDRSILDSNTFIETNILGTHVLLKNSLNYFEKLNGVQKDSFKFIQISTDEVYGSLKKNEPQSIEESPYFPNSPYSASKASGDHLTRAWYKTYGFPVITSNCTNNYGPFQNEEKLIPLTISFCLQGKKLPIYGDGSNIRDWLYVKDHCDALSLILESGKTGETYNIGGKNELKNLEVVNKICNILDKISPKKDGKSYLDQITFVEDRPGHDYRYGLNISKIKSHLGWSPKENFDSGLKKTIEWYLKINDASKR